MYEVGEKKSFARKPQNWNTRPTTDGMKSPFGRLFAATCMLTFWPTLPPVPVSPGTKALSVVLEPRVSLKRLMQVLPQATVSFLTCETALAVPAARLRPPAITATADIA